MAKIRTLVLLVSVLFVLATCGSDDPTDTTTDVGDDVSEELSDDPTEAEPAEDLVDVPDTTEPDEDPTIDPDEGEDGDGQDGDVDDATEPCDAPTNRAFYVDVALDDPDGGLNMRSAAGIDNDIVGVFPRSSELFSTGECDTMGTVDWWEMTTSDASRTGWVSSRFLSDQLVFNPGLGKAIVDTENVSVSGASLEEMATALADAYGFDDDVVITMVGEPIGADAQGGSVVFDLTGLKDDASNGFRLEIDFIFDKDENGGEVESYTAAQITSYSLCSRGVTEDGLCI